jgi:hypothetical protein
MFERIPYTNVHIYAYTLAVALATCGFVLDYFHLTMIDGWFARSGALICMCSISFLLLTMKKLSVLENSIKEYSNLIKDTTIMNHNSSSAMRLKISTDEFSRKMDDQAQESIKRERTTDLKHELRLLMWGTFTWGFGDIPFTLLAFYG